MPGITVLRTLLRKTKTTRITRQMETISEICTSRTEARMVVVRSRATPNLMFCGICAWNVGSSASTRSTVSIIFAPGWRKMTSTMDGLPLTDPPVRTSSTESITLATSASRT